MSNTTRYGVLIDGRRGGYDVVFPDLPGCKHRRRGFAACHGGGRRMGASRGRACASTRIARSLWK
jgi:hypothetical protein